MTRIPPRNVVASATEETGITSSGNTRMSLPSGFVQCGVPGRGGQVVAKLRRVTGSSAGTFTTLHPDLD
jgi:hypothetical protein